MAVSGAIGSAERCRARCEERIADEMARPVPDSLVIGAAKREKLRLKDVHARRA